MSQHAITALPVVDVVDAEGRLVGMVSETDLIARERATAQARAASERRPEQAKARAETAEHLMTSPVATLAGAARLTTTSLGEAAPAAFAGAVRLPAARTLRLRDGRPVRVRPIRASDAEALTHEEALVMATADLRQRFALVATTRRAGREAIVADCRLLTGQGLPAEMAIAVADEYQGAGLGPALIRQLLSIAAGHGIETVDARVKYDNERMMRVLRRLGFRRTAWELGVVTFTQTLPTPSDAASA